MMIEPFSGPDSNCGACACACSRSASKPPTRVPAAVKVGKVPKLDCTSTPTWYSPTWREAEPMPPFSPNDDIPRPAPTAPCANAVPAAAQASA